MSYWRTGVWLGPSTDATLLSVLLEAFQVVVMVIVNCQGLMVISLSMLMHSSGAYNEAQDILQVKSSTILGFNSYFFLSAN